MHLGGIEALVILAVVLLFFGASRLPSLAKNAGESIKIFKDSAKRETPEIEEKDGDEATTQG